MERNNTNLADTLQARGTTQTAGVSKESEMLNSILMDDETSTFSAVGIANDSFHWAVQEIVPPKNTTDVVNPGDAEDKQRRKSKSFRKYEAKIIPQQDTGPRQTMVQTTTVDNSDVVDYGRNWF